MNSGNSHFQDVDDSPVVLPDSIMAQISTSNPESNLEHLNGSRCLPACHATLGAVKRGQKQRPWAMWARDD
jgi:hypothetical protein